VTVLVVAAAVYIGTSAWPVILDETDGQYAGAAREMLQRDDWLVPSNNGVPRLQKPPLVYWLTRLSLQTFGVNEFAARLPNALATVAWVFATYLIGERIGGRKRGLLGATIFGSMLGLFLFSHRIMPEPFLGTFVSLAIWCFLSALRAAPCTPASSLVPFSRFTFHVSRITHHARHSAPWWFFWAWVFMALALMSKGLHGALYPLAIAELVTLGFPRTRPVWRGLASWPGIAAFLAITVPWYAAMVARFPGFLAYHFFSEQAGHAFNTAVPRDCTPVPFGVFWAEHFFFLFPWILFLPAAVFAYRGKYGKDAFQSVPGFVQGIRGRGGMRPYHGDRGHNLNLEPILWIWIVVTALSISFSVRQDHYFMPAWGAVAVCLALPWTAQSDLPRKSLIVPCVTVAVIGAVVATCAAFLNHPMVAAVSEVKPEAARADMQNVMRGLSAAVWRDCSPLAIVVGLAWLAGGCISALLARWGRATTAAFLLAGTMAVVFPMVMRGYTQLQEYFTLANAAKVINRTAGPDALIACEGEPHLSASLFFYLNRQVSWAGAQTGGVLSAESHHLAVGPFVSDDELAANWHSPREVFFILEESNLPEWQRKLGVEDDEMRVVARDGTRVVAANGSAAAEVARAQVMASLGM
jgi:4-amino-4-deoxy-L-arabinose transferase-like glycosyltransferase